MGFGWVGYIQKLKDHSLPFESVHDVLVLGDTAAMTQALLPVTRLFLEHP